MFIIKDTSNRVFNGFKYVGRGTVQAQWSPPLDESTEVVQGFIFHNKQESTEIDLKNSGVQFEWVELK